jgi:hypothetical protein
VFVFVLALVLAVVLVTGFVTFDWTWRHENEVQPGSAD